MKTCLRAGGGLLLGVLLIGLQGCKEEQPTPPVITIAPPAPAPEMMPVVMAAPSAPAPVSAPTPVPTPHPAMAARERAVQLYPDLARADSALHTAFMELLEERKQKDPEALTNPQWPITLAQDAARMMGVTAAREQPAEPVQATQKPETPSWFRSKLEQRTSSLDNGPYNRTPAVPYYYYPRYYDSYGRFYVDAYGYRHYVP